VHGLRGEVDAEQYAILNFLEVELHILKARCALIRAKQDMLIGFMAHCEEYCNAANKHIEAALTLLQALMMK